MKTMLSCNTDDKTYSRNISHKSVHNIKSIERYLHKSRDQLINPLVNRDNIIHHICNYDDEWLKG